MMKKTIFILLMLISISAFAQERQQRGNRGNMSAEERANMMVSRVSDQLELTETQQAQLKKVFTEQAEEQRAGMAGRRQNKDRPSREEMRKAFEERRQAMQEKLQKILTEEQYAEWQEITSRMRERRRNRS